MNEEKIICFYHLKTESGDEHLGSVETTKADHENDVRKHIINTLWHELEFFIDEHNELEKTNYDQDWCFKNPKEALEIGLLYPSLHIHGEDK